jgi:multidrug efflux pump
MRGFTDLFIRKPVLAIVVSALILVLGLKSLGGLQVLQYPKTENATITITTTYSGADPATIAGFITTPIENAVAQVDGIDDMTSTSQTRSSRCWCCRSGRRWMRCISPSAAMCWPPTRSPIT